MVGIDRFHRIIFRLKPKAAVFFIKPLDRCLIINQRDDDFAIFSGGGPAGDNQIAVEDAGFDHAFPAHPQGKQFF